MLNNNTNNNTLSIYIVLILWNKIQNITFYNNLGVETNASFSEIKDAYRNLIIQHHPDKGGNKNIFQKIQDAWAVLRDAELRRKYDARSFLVILNLFQNVSISNTFD